MEYNQRIAELFDKYIAGTTTTEETSYLLDYFGSDEGSDKLSELVNSRFDKVDHEKVDLTGIYPLTDRVSKKLNQAIREELHVKPVRRLKLSVIAIAASILLVVASIASLLLYQTEQQQQSPQKIADVAPGGNRATLTLADGTTILLDDIADGKIVEQTGIVVSKTGEGQLIYTLVGDLKTTSTAYNTITTPRGGQYQIHLPDGSKIWLNAASSLKYPASFANLKQRRVELTGEAYFEISKNPQQPFIVETSIQEVEVLGTQFNINSYKDERSTVTTLEEGSVRITSNNEQSVNIRPGQQGINTSGKLDIQPANLETALAWKNGEIYFKNSDLRSIMRQVARWYDLEVKYEGELPERTFSGGIPRSSNLSSLLRILELNNIHFVLQGRTLIVKP